ncbi:MAG: S-layer homology domain-containing protein, partial [Oscillospiraceae bacterium]|nr:S-layer homology domain-containing protein [Oscillospiraceae bacterium]
GRQVSVELGGTQLEKFTDLTVFAEGKNSGMSYLVGGAEDPFATEERTLVLELPEHMVSDTYSLRIIATEDTDTYYSEGEIEISYSNPDQPAAPAGFKAENAGDYKVAVTVEPSEGDFDGYEFTAYDAEGNPVNGVTGILLYKDGSPVAYGEDGTILPAASTQLADSYLIGGHYEQTVEDEEGKESTLITGFDAGEYTIELRRWKHTARGGVLVSEPKTASVTVREPVRTELRVTAASLNGGNSLLGTITRGDGTSYEQMSFSSSELLLRLSSDTESFMGKWYLDGGHLEDGKGQIPELTKTADISLKGLKDGTHMLTFTGKNAYGDSIRTVYQFTVDTQGPRLLLAEPVNGSLFHYWTGKLSISGITDAGSKLTVWDNTTGAAVYEGSEPIETDSEGAFTQEITLDRSILSHDLTITVADALGNESSKDVSVMSNGLGSIDKLLLFAGQTDVTNTKMTAGGTQSLRLMAKLKRPENAAPAEEDIFVLINKAGMVDWVRTAAEGQAEITDTDTGIELTTSSDAEGMVIARFLVNDLGEYSVCAAFGFTGEQIRDLNDGYTQVLTTDQLYTGQPRSTQVEVLYRGIRLVEGTDYIIGEYSNNVDVTTPDRKAQVEIIGMGSYSGTVFGQFEIRYLEFHESWITLSGVEGDNDFYRSDVSVIPAPGYELVVDGETAQITLSADGEHTVSFRIRRISDGAMTDVLTYGLQIDQTAPTGSITLDETTWSRFLETITFGYYKVQSLEATLTAEDASGISSIEYAVTGTSYASVTELEAAGITWELYSESQKPTLKENEDQILYVRITDRAGNVSYLCSDGIHVDTLAPVVTVAVDMASVTGNSFSASITSNEAGTYHYAVLKAGEPAPTVEALLSVDLPGAIMGSGKLSADQAVTVTVPGLEINTAYTLYAVAEDTVILLSDGSAAPNVSDVASSELVVTARCSLEQAVVTVENMLYTGEAVTPAVAVSYEGKQLIQGQDYEVTYHNNVEVSATEPYVQILGMGDYSGSVTMGFTISYLEAEEYSIQGTQGNEGYYVSAVTLTANEGYELVAVENSQLAFSEDGSYEAKFRIRRMDDGAMTDVFTLALKLDLTAPQAAVTVGDNTWKEFLNTITFGLFFKETQTVTIEAEDTGSGIKEISYYVSDTALTSEQVMALKEQWTAYEDGISIAPDSKCVVYAKILDQAGNISYRSSDGLIVENTLAVILGVEDGGVYYGDQTVTVIDENLDTVTVDGREVVLTDNSFVIPADNAQHTIVATDKAGNVTTVTITVNVPVCDGINDCPSLAFTDLDTTAWYHLYTDFVIEEGYMQGHSHGIFAPNGSMSRAMMVQVLYNLEGRPAVSGENAFLDTAEEEWYYDAVQWASQNGLVKGYGKGKFGPEDDISREQMVTIFYRYSQFKGYRLTEGEYDQFSDKDKVSAYARKAMAWAVGNGLIVGTGDNLLQPTAPSTRAQFAAVLQRFMEAVEK